LIARGRRGPPLFSVAGFRYFFDSSGGALRWGPPRSRAGIGNERPRIPLTPQLDRTALRRGEVRRWEAA